MAELIAICQAVPNRTLIDRLKNLSRIERRSLALLIVHLIEFDKRKLYADEGYSSLFAYCTKELHYSESSAGKRIYAARAARKFPAILHLLDSGELHLESILLIAPHLTEENHLELLARAQGRSKRELESMVGSLAPKTIEADIIRRLGTHALPAPCQADPEGSDEPLFTTRASAVPAGADRADVGASRIESATPSAGSRIPPIDSAMGSITPETPRPAAPRTATERVRISFTCSEKTAELLEKARGLLRHRFPAGRLEDILKEALEALLNERDPERRPHEWKSRKARRVESGKSRGLRVRRIPQWVKDEVWRRDGGRCVFATADGSRCLERGGLEYDHIVPWALGGYSDDPRNIRLLCHAHNQLSARRIFGERMVGKHRREHRADLHPG
jgi:hypothetical protein